MNKSLKYILHISCLFTIITGCTVFSNNTTTPLTEEKPLQIAGLSLENVPDLSNVYRIHGVKLDEDLFFTKLPNCREDGTSVSSLITQIFRGFTPPKITTQKVFTISETKLQLSQIKTEYASTPLFIALYSTTSLECTKDFIFWSSSDLNQLQETDLNKLTRLIAALLER